jgi:hypothetical protein
MPLIVVTASLLSATLFFGCRTQQTGTTRIITLRGDTVIRNRVVPVVSPADSARIKALMRCDENGRVLLDWYEQECSKNARLKFKLDSVGKLMIDFDVLRDTVYIPVADTTVNRSSSVEEVKTVEVERKMRWWEKYLIGVGILSHGVLIGFGVFKLRKLWI